MKDIQLQVDELTLQAEIFDAGGVGKRPAVLLIHGWESAQDRMFALAEELSSLGYICLTVDLRGHGKSLGDHKIYSRQDFFKDVLAAYDLLAAQEAVDPNRIFAIGSSFGGYLSALLAGQRNLRGVCLRVPADYRDVGMDTPLYEQRGQWDHSEWKSKSHTADETASLRALHGFSGAVLVVESEKDELVPAATVQSYCTAVPDPSKLTYKLMLGAPHSITRHPELQAEFSKIVFSWLNTIAL